MVSGKVTILLNFLGEVNMLASPYIIDLISGDIGKYKTMTSVRMHTQRD